MNNRTFSQREIDAFRRGLPRDTPARVEFAKFADQNTERLLRVGWAPAKWMAAQERDAKLSIKSEVGTTETLHRRARQLASTAGGLEVRDEVDRAILAHAMTRLESLAKAGVRSLPDYVRHYRRDMDSGRVDAPELKPSGPETLFSAGSQLLAVARAAGADQETWEAFLDKFFAATAPA